MTTQGGLGTSALDLLCCALAAMLVIGTLSQSAESESRDELAIRITLLPGLGITTEKVKAMTPFIELSTNEETIRSMSCSGVFRCQEGTVVGRVQFERGNANSIRVTVGVMDDAGSAVSAEGIRAQVVLGGRAEAVTLTRSRLFVWRRSLTR